MRREGEDGRYYLDQLNYLQTINRIWGGEKHSTTAHHNDHIHVYGLIMARPESRVPTFGGGGNFEATSQQYIIGIEITFPEHYNLILQRKGNVKVTQRRNRS